GVGDGRAIRDLPASAAAPPRAGASLSSPRRRLRPHEGEPSAPGDLRILQPRVQPMRGVPLPSARSELGPQAEPTDPDLLLTLRDLLQRAPQRQPEARQLALGSPQVDRPGSRNLKRLTPLPS